MNRVSFLILSNLGLIACAEAAPPPSNEAMAPLVIPPMPSVTASASAPPRTIPAPTASQTTPAPDEDDDDDVVAPVPVRPPPPAPPPPVPRKTCRTDRDCGSSQHCALPAGKKIGNCTPIVIMRGRPLLIGGDAHLAEYTHPATAKVTLEEEAERLREAAREEHASIAAFARTIAELMALGAPLWLLEETQRAMADEIRHTERSLAMLEKLTGERARLGPLPAAVAPLARPIEDFFRDILHGGAIGETRAAEEAEARRLTASDPELRDFYDMIVVDESRHAALAIKTLAWLIEQRPSLQALLGEA